MTTCLWIYTLYTIKRLTFWYFLKVKFTLPQHFALFSEIQEGKKPIPVQSTITRSICICRCHCLLVGQVMSPHRSGQIYQRSHVSGTTLQFAILSQCINLLEYPIPPPAAATRHKNRTMAISREPSVVS